jgi:hypothetical protein
LFENTTSITDLTQHHFGFVHTVCAVGHTLRNFITLFALLSGKLCVEGATKYRTRELTTNFEPSWENTVVI